MNKLISTDLNGFPFVLDDLRFVDDGIRDAFNGVVSNVLDTSLVNDGFIFDKFKTLSLSKHYITQNSSLYPFPATYGVVNGEIVYIPAQNLVSGVTGDYLVLELDLSFDSNGTKVFEDTNIHETYQKRRGKFTKKSSIVEGTDIPIFVWNDAENGWEYITAQLYNFRFGNMIGFNGIEFAVGTHSSQISALQGKVQNVENAWTYIDKTLIPSKLYLNASSNPIDFAGDLLYSTHPSSPTIDTANSYLKYKKNGKTLHVDFLFNRMEIPTLDANSGYAMINFDFTGIIPALTSVESFRATALGLEENFSGSTICGLSGNYVEIYAHKYKTRAFAMNLLIPFRYSSAYFNKGYDTSVFPIASSDTLDFSVFKWTFRGQFTCEIS